MTVYLGLVGACSPAPQVVSCGEIEAGLARDECVLDRLLERSADDYDNVVKDAEQIQDLIVRATGIYEWLRTNASRTTPEQGQRLCSLLRGDEQRICLRRQAAAHMGVSDVEKTLAPMPPTGPANPGKRPPTPEPPDGVEGAAN